MQSFSMHGPLYRTPSVAGEDMKLNGVKKGKRSPKEIKPASFTVMEVARIVAASRRQLDYWDRTGLLSPSLKVVSGKDTKRCYSVQDIIELKIIVKLLRSSLSLQQIRTGFHFIQKRREDLATSIILTDGKTIYLNQDDDLLVDMLKKGQIVSRIAVQDLIAEVQEKVNESW
jgi:DNA-binding transcriptional MerR regulator